ncbi:DNA recombination protein RmuC, partial [Mesonia mobilis]|uniref:DNA recombination protein RmuC n=1 Tax=Mesonia mobilis TaxID=369791 RepID=UPI0026EC51AC
MTEYIIFGVIAVVMLFIGIFIGKRLGKLKQQSLQKSLESEVSSYQLQWETSEKNLQEVKTERDSLRNEKDFFKDELTRKNVEFENLQERNQEQKQEVEQLQEKFQKEFENLAHKIFDQNSEKFSNQNKENIQHILNPLQEKIKVFEEKVEKNSLNSVKINAELSKQLQFLNEQNLKISEEATNLTKALKGDTKMQGNWGEMVLERVLERSGLQKNSEYFVQQNFRTEEGKRVMPDVIIELPGDKKMIIDSKVSLNAYERYVNETEETQKPLHLKKHLIAVKNRVDE